MSENTNLSIDLTESEKGLISQIDFHASAGSYNHASWRPVAEAMLELMRSLLQRDAIPEARKKFFTDPAYNIGGRGLSPLQVFEKNGTRGDDIFRHGNFIKYLRYFVFGPDLPESVISSFQHKVADCGKPFTSGDTLTVADFARQLTRSHKLDSRRAAEEFYKLALDCGLDADDARSVRDRVQRVKV